MENRDAPRRLAVGRRRDESVTITLLDGRQIVVTTTRRVRLVISAPADIEILRTELIERKRPIPRAG